MNIRIDTFPGQQAKFPLEHRILNMILVFGAIMSSIAVIKDFIIGLGAVVTAITFGGVVLFSCLYYLSAIKEKYGMSVFSGMIVFTFAFIPAVWIYNGGILGSFPYYIVIFSSTAAIILSGLIRLVFIFCLTGVISALIMFEYKYPFFIKDYSTNMARFADISIALILALISNALLFATVVNDYKKENRRVRDYLTQLETANMDLQQEMTERRKAEVSVRESEEKYKTIFETTGTAVIIIEQDGTISLVNEEFEKLSGHLKSDIEEKISWEQFILPGSIARMSEYHCNYGCDRCVPLKDYETRFLNKQGDTRDVIISISLIPGTKQRVASFVDISNIKQAEAQLKYLATYDYLTGILNRYSFEEALNQVLIRAGHGRKSALLFIDIDNFKLINDANGHAAGDDVLIKIASAIKESLREGDILARLGGDEFGVLLEDTTVEEAALLAEMLRRITDNDELCSVKLGCFNSSFSIGVVMIDGTLSSQRLLSLADTALYAAKEKGRNRVVMLRPDMETATEPAEINHVYGLIRNALKEDRFVLYYQPVVRVDNGETVHYEALIRLEEEDGQLILPQKFIPVAERFGLMPQIDRWVVEASLDGLYQHPGLNLFVNISGISLGEESLLQAIEEMIIKSGTDPSRIGFEITETVAVRDMSVARRWIERLNKLGCRFALDDFGIGFSSFSYLRMLPVDYLKIDGSFIRNLDKSSSNRALVEAMNTIAHSLHKRTVAEYVENSNVLAILKELKTDYAQGYFLGRPAPLMQSALAARS